MGYRLKAYPSGGLGHTAIDAALELRELVALDDIARIDVAITNFAARRLTDKYPQTEESAKFSGPYLAAYTLVHGAPMFAAFTEEALHDEAVRSLARKVSLATYAEYADLVEDSPAKVTVTLNDGRKIALIIDFAETIAPAGDLSGLAAEDRNALVTLKRWAQNPAFQLADLTICLVAENLAELNPVIVQNPGVTMILYEPFTTYRQIFTDGRALPKDPNPTWMGYSVGKWDGDAFVVDSLELQDTSFSVWSLPIGRTLYARLWTQVNGV